MVVFSLIAHKIKNYEHIRNWNDAAHHLHARGSRMIYVLAALIVIGICWSAVIARRRHVEQRAQERLCKCRKKDGSVCGKKTIRHYQMIVPARSRERAGKWTKLFRSVTFDVCPDDHVKLIDAVLKRFLLTSLVWKHVRNPQQFIIDETLFQRAGLIDRVEPSLTDRMKNVELRRMDNISRIRPHLPAGLPPAQFVKK